MERIHRLARLERRAVVLATSRPCTVSELCDRVLLFSNRVVCLDCVVGELPSRVCDRFYRITVGSRIEQDPTGWFDDLVLTAHQGSTTLTGVVADQSALQGVLARIRDLGLNLVSVDRADPDPEEVLDYLVRVESTHVPHVFA